MHNATRNWPHNWQTQTRYFDSKTQRFYIKTDTGKLVPVQNAIARKAKHGQKGK